MKTVTVFVCLLLIGAAWCACDACGPECASACGSRRFRACCFNYLRRKRTSQAIQSWSAVDEDSQPKWRLPTLVIKYVPEDISNILGDNLGTSDDIQH